MDRSEKDIFVAHINNLMAETYCGQNINAACLYWAGMVCKEINKDIEGPRAIIQGGSMSWPCMGDVDDGVSPTHFSYIFEAGDPQTHKQLKLGRLPEMHVWVAIPETQEIIDLTTKYLTYQAMDLANIKWTAAIPPDYLWVQGVQSFPSLIRLGSSTQIA